MLKRLLIHLISKNKVYEYHFKIALLLNLICFTGMNATGLASYCSNSNEKGSLEKNSFSWKDEIYWHLKLDTPLTEFDRNSMQISFGFVIQDQVTYLKMSLTPEEMEQTYFVFDILPLPDKATCAYKMLNPFSSLEAEVKYYNGKKSMKKQWFFTKAMKQTATATR